MRDVVVTPIKDPKALIAIASAVILTIVFAWFAIPWQISDMLAQMTRRDDPNAVEIADFSVQLAPSNPSASRFRASLGEDPLSADKRNAIEIAEATVRLAPYDYRWRVELARAYAQDEQFERAEAEFKRALDIAPAYSAVRWHYGNFLLRRERVEEAFEQLKRAAADNSFYRNQVLSVAWDFFDKDANRLEALVGDGTQGRTQLAYFFAARGRAEDALKNWNLLSDEEKAANSQFLKTIAQGVFEQKHFPQALEFERQLGAGEDVLPEAITNASFERGLGGSERSRFTWQVVRGIQKLDISSDTNVKRDGARSVRVSFRGYEQPELANLSQIVVVEPSKKYRLRFWLRTENLKSAGPPLLEIVSANDNRPIAKTPPFGTGSNDWQEIVLDFTTPENCNAVTVRTARQFCGAGCPLTGTFWYDDFELQK